MERIFMGEYDIIVAPSNLGMTLAAKGADQYELAAVITWGNLYLVAEDEDALNEEGELAAFGEAAVPHPQLLRFSVHPGNKFFYGSAAVARYGQGRIVA